jgi:SAM-dependent methyltransferase
MDAFEINIITEIRKYFTKLVNKHGATPQGVGWRDEESQLIRFEQLLKIVKEDNNFTINELGCGYGRLYEYMNSKGYSRFTYRGYDLSTEMILNAKKLHKHKNCHFYAIDNMETLNKADYAVASGIFNVKMGYDNKRWTEYIFSNLDVMNRMSNKGFSFNILTKYSDKHLMKNELYYADPCMIFDYCKKHYSRNVALLHDYNLYEFTMLVKKY